MGRLERRAVGMKCRMIVFLPLRAAHAAGCAQDLAGNVGRLVLSEQYIQRGKLSRLSSATHRRIRAEHRQFVRKLAAAGLQRCPDRGFGKAAELAGSEMLFWPKAAGAAEASSNPVVRSLSTCRRELGASSFI
jgi:hypothetical protein